jgi:hypothetical protein
MIHVDGVAWRQLWETMQVAVQSNSFSVTFSIVQQKLKPEAPVNKLISKRILQSIGRGSCMQQLASGIVG